MGPQGPAGAGNTLVRKTADESVTSSTTLQNDDHLSLEVGANETWEFEAFILATSSSQTPDLKFTFTVPTGTSIDWTANSVDSSAASSYPPVSASGTSVSPAISANAMMVVRVRGVLTVGSTAGSLQLQWSQNQSNNNAVTVKARSFLKGGKF